MTFNAAYKIETDSEKAILLVSDAMSSDFSSKEKADKFQKLSRVGNYLLLHGGSTSYNYNLISKLEQHSVAPMEEFANSLRELMASYSFSRNVSLGIILAGQDGDTLRIDGLMTPEIRSRKPISLSAEDIIHDKNCDSRYQGSGGKPVQEAINGSNAWQRPIIIRSLADAVGVFHLFNTEAAKNIAVNDKTQFGFITPNSVIRLYHPDIELRDYVAYSEERFSLQLDPKLTSDFAVSLNNLEKTRAINRFDAEFYHAFITALNDYKNKMLKPGETTEFVAAGDCDIQSIAYALEKRKEAQAVVQDGLDALLSSQPKKMRTFIKKMRKQADDQFKILPF